jgi:hypothetical protein
MLRSSYSEACIHVPLGLVGSELSGLRRQVGDHKISGCRIDIRLAGWHQEQSTHSKRTFWAPSLPNRALKISSGGLVVRDWYLGHKGNLEADKRRRSLSVPKCANCRCFLQFALARASRPRAPSTPGQHHCRDHRHPCQTHQSGQKREEKMQERQ